MRILLDHGTPRPLRGHLPEHVVDTAAERGWSRLGNGELLAEAERAAYDVLITTDQNMRYQQNLAALRLAIVVLRARTGGPGFGGGSMRSGRRSERFALENCGKSGSDERGWRACRAEEQPDQADAGRGRAVPAGARAAREAVLAGSLIAEPGAREGRAGW